LAGRIEVSMGAHELKEVDRRIAETSQHIERQSLKVLLERRHFLSTNPYRPHTT